MSKRLTPEDEAAIRKSPWVTGQSVVLRLLAELDAVRVQLEAKTTALAVAKDALERIAFQTYSSCDNGFVRIARQALARIQEAEGRS